MSNKYPPRSETELQLEARVIALEYLLKHCFWNLIVQQIHADDGDDGDAVNEAKLFRELCRESLKKAAFTGVGRSAGCHAGDEEQHRRPDFKNPRISIACQPFWLLALM
jgi:hypothetical protein